MKANRDGYRALARRAEEILFKINDIVPDPGQMPPDFLDRISDFVRCVEPIQEYMEGLQGKQFQDKLKRIVRHKEHQEKISEFNQDLDRALQSFC